MRIGPTALIVGAPRSGTTSLFEYLSAHPQITPSRRKETYYFHVCAPRPSVAELAKQRGEGPPFGARKWQRAVEEIGFQSVGSYHSMWPTDDTKHRIEATPLYLCDPLVPARIARSCPHAMIIVCVRQPVRRALSHWALYRRNKREPLDDPVRSFELEPVDVDEFYWGVRNYQRCSFYGRQVKRYTDRFGRERVKVLVFEEFLRHPKRTVADLLRWLGLAPHPAVMELVRKGRTHKVEVDHGWVRDLTCERFAGDIEMLGGLTGKDLSFWLDTDR